MGLAEFLADAGRAADLVAQAPPGTRWLLACDTDADGLCAAAVAAQAMRHARRPFVVRASRDKTEAASRSLFAEPQEGLVLLDKGTSHLDALREQATATGKRVVILDHHNVPGGATGTAGGAGAAGPGAPLVLVNPRVAGLDGSRDASAATTAAAFALALGGDAALAWVPTALAGAVGDLQDVGGWQGWNAELANRARAAGHLGSAKAPRLSHAPAALLEELGLAPGDAPDDISAEARTRLVSGLALRRVAEGATPSPADVLEDVDLHVPLGATLRQVCRTVDACGREGQAATGVAYLIGDRQARAEAAAVLAKHRAALAAELESVRARGIETRRAFRVAWSDRANDSGLVADAILAAAEPSSSGGAPPPAVVVLARRPDGAFQVSTRAATASGLDLGRALAAAAKAAGGEGGGHPVAAGAVVPEAHVGRLLDALEGELMDQASVRRA
jgi:single-stranded-DNA-specific exonuclease